MKKVVLLTMTIIGIIKMKIIKTNTNKKVDNVGYDNRIYDKANIKTTNDDDDEEEDNNNNGKKNNIHE